MKKLLAFMFLLSSVSFVGCAQKEPPVEEPAKPAIEEAAPAAGAAAAPAADKMDEHSEEAAH